MIVGDAWTNHARKINGFNPETAGEDEFLAHIQMLESVLDAIDEAAARNASGEFSAADLAGVVFHHGLGNCKVD